MSAADDKAREAEQTGMGMMELDRDNPAKSAFDMLTATILGGNRHVLVVVLWTNDDGQGQADVAADKTFTYEDVRYALRQLSDAADAADAKGWHEHD